MVPLMPFRHPTYKEAEALYQAFYYESIWSQTPRWLWEGADALMQQVQYIVYYPHKR